MGTVVMNAETPNRSYAVVWQHDGHDPRSGGLRCSSEGLCFDGQAADHVPFEQIVEVSVLRGRSQRLRGLPVLALTLKNGRSLRIASVEGMGRLHELALQLRSLVVPVSD